MISKSLPEWLAYLDQLHPQAIDMGLGRSREVFARLALQRPAPRVITVTGTNGKGSTCAFLAELLRAQELRVGVYSSPHLLAYNERVVIDGQQASDAQLCEAFAATEAARGAITLTYFEMGTLAAFWLFQRAMLDVLILEVGLGGRLDTVNLLDADLALVSSIGLDHAEWLGDTRESVAFEKAGIFRPGKPVVCGDPTPPVPLLARATELQAPFYQRGVDFDVQADGCVWHWYGHAAAGGERRLRELPLLGLPQENAALALQAYSLLDLPWQPDVLVAALQRTRLAGRLERRSLQWQGKSLTLLLDVGHNAHAASYLAGRFALQPVRGRRLAVFGLLAEKDLVGVVRPLLDHVTHWAVSTLPSPRSRRAAELQLVLRQLGAAVTAYAEVGAALQRQCEQATEADEVLVFGSFYCVAAAMAWLAERGAGNGRAE